MPLFRLLAVLVLLAFLGACASHRGGGGGSASAPSRGAYKVGNPYQIDGVTYVPQEEFNHVETVVRINDRGPYARGRIIDMSRAAAEELQMTGRGTAHVRIDQLGPESQTVKEVALNGGGPSEQQAALVQLASGQRNAPVPATVA